jgi:hypothetical protein
MDEEDNDDIAAAMGFASFGGTKKRKFDHTNLPKAKADASGANSTQLGVRTKKAASAQETETENTPTDHLNQAAHAFSSVQPETAPEPAGEPGLADIIAYAQTLPDKPPGNFPPSGDQFTAEMLSFGGPSISRAELNALRNGVRNEHGDTAYFLPSFVEDPWEKFRKGGRV